jgi:tetratricopeptide (TPR) repeat protein
MVLFGRELTVVERLHAAAPADSLWASRIATSLQRRGKLKAMQGQAHAALPDLERAAAMLEQVARGDPNNRLWQNNLMVVQLDLARMRTHAGGAQVALPVLQDLAERAARLTALDPKKTDWSRLSALVDMSIGDALLRLGRLPEAEQQIGRAIARLASLHAANPLDKRLAYEVARATMEQAELDRHAGRTAAMRAACQRAATIVGAPGPQADYRILEVWARAQTCLGTNSATEAAARLRAIGYREVSYERFMSQPR